MWMGSTNELRGHVSICYIYVSFVSKGKLGISPMDFGPTRKPIWAQEKASIEEEENDDVFFANCVHTI